MNNLHLSYEAQNDLSDIKDYIAEDLENPQAASSATGSAHNSSMLMVG